MTITKAQTRIANEILLERNRQDQLVADGRHPFNCATPGIPDERKFPVLMEEAGEVATEVYDILIGRLSRPKLRTELIQLAAVAMAWVEAIDADGEVEP